jgi:hypothetical protein
VRLGERFWWPRKVGAVGGRHTATTEEVAAG